MKEKFKRRHMSHLGSNVDINGKVDRSMQKSMRKETIHFNNRDRAWLALVSLSFISGMMKGFKGLMRFLFNNTSGGGNEDFGIPYFKPIKDELLKSNPNQNKRWYKTHVPKSMRKGLTHLEVTQLRQKVYARQVRYV